MGRLIKSVRTSFNQMYRTTWEISGETPRYRVWKATFNRLKSPYSLWNANNPPGSMDFYSVENPEEAHYIIQMWNAEVCGLEELEADGKYYEWYSEIDDENIQDTEEFIKEEL